MMLEWKQTRNQDYNNSPRLNSTSKLSFICNLIDRTMQPLVHFLKKKMIDKENETAACTMSLWKFLNQLTTFTVRSRISDPSTSHRIRCCCWSKVRWLVNVCISFISVPVQNDPISATTWPPITYTASWNNTVKRSKWHGKWTRKAIEKQKMTCQ